MVYGKWCSKLRYGLQLYGKTRTDNTQSTQADLDKLQVTQNKLLRVLEGVNLSKTRIECSILKLSGHKCIPSYLVLASRAFNPRREQLRGKKEKFLPF